MAQVSFDRIVVTDDTHRDLILDTLMSFGIPKTDVVFVE